MVFLLAASCGEDPGSFTMSFSWDKAPGDTVYIWVRVEHRTDPETPGTILTSAGPEAYTIGEPVALEMADVPNGDDRYIIADVRESANTSLSILYYGISHPFSLAPGLHTHVEVPLDLQTPESQLHTATVELLFDGKTQDTVGENEIKDATVATHSSGAVSIFVANDASFDAGLAEYTIGESEELTCTTDNDADGVTWDQCQIDSWDLLAGLDEESDQAYTVFVKFLDRYGYESQVYKASVVLDSEAPLVIVASMTPPVARPGGEVYLNVSFHEPLAVGGEPAALHVAPELPAGSTSSGPSQVGNSNAYVWVISISDGPIDEATEYTFSVDVEDLLGNAVTGQPLLDEAGEPLTMRIDATPPTIVEPADISFDQSLFGLIDEDAVIAFDFALAELNHHDIGADGGECTGICPEARIGNKALGDLTRNPLLDDAKEGRLGFTYSYTLSLDDWGEVDKEVDIAVLWSDEAGNSMEEVLPAKLHFDFVRPSTFNCALLPVFANGNDKFTYSMTVSEELSELPEVVVNAETDGLFTGDPTVSEDGFTYTWEQSAAGLPSQTFVMGARLVDLAGNASFDGDAMDEYICRKSASVDGSPPQITNPSVETVPEVLDAAGEVVIACGHGDILRTIFEVDEPDGLPEGYPEVMLSVPGDPIPLSLVDAVEMDGGALEYHYELVLDATLHGSAEGTWPIRVTIFDLAGNQLVVEPLADRFALIDFTPPAAECSLIPSPGANGYAIDQKIMLQVTPVEALDTGSVPLLQESFNPPFDVPFFSFEAETAYRFSRVVAADDGERTFSVMVELVDLVGNSTPADTTACTDGIISGAIDGETPVVQAVEIEVDEGTVDPAEIPLRAGRLVQASVQLTNTTLKPSVTLGTGSLDATAEAPEEMDAGVYLWVFERVLDGTEGEGPQALMVGGLDEAGNAFSHVESEQPLTLDFTPPSAKCVVFPTSAKIGDDITITVNATEPLDGGLPQLTSDLNFIPPTAEPLATTFAFHHAVKEEDQEVTDWTYTAKLTDRAGNAGEGEFACSGGGVIDAIAPALANPVVETDPAVVNGKGETVLAVGHLDLLRVGFDVLENDLLKEGSPLVYLEVAGAPIELSQTTAKPQEGGYSCAYELTMDQVAHQGMEGLWPLKAVLEDAAGNIVAVEALASVLIKVDFTPPTADCSLIPGPGAIPYPIGQKVTLQVFPMEELEKDSLPQLVETVEPPLAEPCLTYEEGSAYRFSHTVVEGDGEHSLALAVRLTDLVGNVTPEGGSGCSAALPDAAFDGTTPSVVLFEIEVEEGAVEPATTPLCAGLEIVASVQVANTQVMPEVSLGTSAMEAMAPTELPGGVYEWKFVRTLDGTEGDGTALFVVSGTDEALNPYEFTSDTTVVLDFTPPTAKCTQNPPVPKLGDQVSVTVNVSEPLLGGKPGFSANVLFVEPEADADGTFFEYSHMVDDDDANKTAWTYTVTLTDLAGNASEGDSACSGGGTVDALAPKFESASVTTEPVVVNGDGATVLVAGEQDKLLVTLNMVEAQGFADDSPQVTLQVAGNPTALTPVSVQETEAEHYACLFQLEFDVAAHQFLEGTWTLRAEATDVAGNATVVDALEAVLVRVDFTAPTAECAIIPAPTGIPFSVGDKVTLQLSVLEELDPNQGPQLVEELGPALPSPFFSHEPDTTYRYSRVIEENDGEGDFSVGIRLQDLAGNVTAVDGTACSDGFLQGSVDGATPVVTGPFEVGLDGGTGDPSLPIRAGRTVEYAFSVQGTNVLPEVSIGTGAMEASAQTPEDLGNGLYGWTFSRTLDGSEGEGERHFAIQGADMAGNPYSYTDHQITVYFDFTAPTASCQQSPTLAKLGDTLTVTVNASEALRTGKPDFDSSLQFDEPAADGNLFIYSYVLSEAEVTLEEWTWSVIITDLAGNKNEGDFACTGGADLDASPPVLYSPAVTTDPTVINAAWEEVLAVGPGNTVRASFTVGDVQGLAAGYPEVLLNVPGSPVSFEQTEVVDNNGSWDYTYELKIDADLHAATEGSRTVKILAADIAGNLVSDEALADAVVRIDLTAPVADCSLIPAPDDNGYGISSKVSVQISPIEELAKDSVPELVENFIPAFGGDFFSYEESTSYRFSHTVADSDGERGFQLTVRLEDLVGNQTAAQANACVGGTLDGTIDGLRPQVTGVVLSLQGSADDPTVVPLKSGRTVLASITVVNSHLEPTVLLGEVAMSKVPDAGGAQGNDTWLWFYSRTLDGSEGEGTRRITVSGEDAAGNSYSYVENDETMTLDFTTPTAQCSAVPATAKIGDTVVVSVNTSEPLQDGLPSLTPSGIVLSAPGADEDGTSFAYNYTVTEGAGITDWSYIVGLCDVAGNCDDAACTGEGVVDAVRPSVGGAALTTDPVAQNLDGDTLIAVGHGDAVEADFIITESQGLVQTPPDVYLDVSGDPISFDAGSCLNNGNGTYDCHFTLIMSSVEHALAEGNWPVRVVVGDAAGNTYTVNSLAGEAVRVDFTPPQADCSVIPTAGDYGFPIGQQVSLQVTALEQLAFGTAPVLDQVSMLQDDFFIYDAGTEFRYSGTVSEEYAEHSVGVDVQLTDVVGNTTPEGTTACTQDHLSVSLDALRPTVQSVAFSASDGLDPLTDKLRAGRTLTAIIQVNNTNLEPQVTIGSGTMSRTGGPTTVSQDRYQWTFRRTLTGIEGEGDRSLVVGGADSAGNIFSYTHGQTVDFDFTQPSAQCLLNLQEAKAGDIVEVMMLATEHISGIPTATVTSGDISFAYDGEYSNPDADSPRFIWKYTVPDGKAATEWVLELKAQDDAGNPNPIANICDVGGLVDGTPIAVSNTSVSVAYQDPDDPATWHATGTYAKDESRVEIVFTVDQVPDLDQIEVAVGDDGADYYSLNGNTFTYVYFVDGDDFNGTAALPVSATVLDSVDNETYESIGVLTVDVEAPALSGTPHVERCDNHADGVLNTYQIYMRSGLTCEYYGSASTSCAPQDPPPGGTMRVSVGTNEGLRHARLSVYLDETHAFNADPCGDGGYIYATYEPNGTETADAWSTVYGNIEDLAGNRATVELGQVYFDFTAPEDPDVETDGTIVYVRIPWGVKESSNGYNTDGAKRFDVRGFAGAVEANSRVKIYDGVNTASAQQIATGLADWQGKFGAGISSVWPLTLGASDRPYVYMTATDLAGNQSDGNGDEAGPQARLVRNVEYVATLNDKVAGSSLANPNSFEAVQWFQDSLVQYDAVEVGDDAGMAERDSDVLTTQGAEFAWANMGPTTSYPIERRRHGMAFDSARRRIVMFGGNASTGNAKYGDTWEWNGHMWNQLSIADPEGDGNPSSRTHISMAYDARRGKTIIYGGNTADGNQEDTWEFDGTSWEQIFPSDPEGDGGPGELLAGQMTYDSARGVVLLYGGRVGTVVQDDLWAYDGTSWELLTPTDPEGDGNPAERKEGALTFDRSRGVAVLFGGKNDAGDRVTETWEWGGTSWEEITPTDPEGDGNPAGRYELTMNYDATREVVLLYGGYATTYTSELWEWDGTSWDLVAPDDPENDGDPGNLSGHGAAFFDSTGVLVIFGGLGNSDLHKTWYFNGTSWRDGGPEDGNLNPNPGQRKYHSSAYDTDRKRVVVYGGDASGSLLGDTWEWSGSLWTEISPLDAEADGDPDTVEKSAMTYAPLFHDGETYLFGGSTAANDYPTETWRFDGIRWLDHPNEDDDSDYDYDNDDEPGARRAHGMAYDGGRARIVLFGGFVDGVGYSNETWEMYRRWVYDGGWVLSPQWKLISPSDPQSDGNPASRQYCPLAYDAGRALTVMYGGLSIGANYRNDTWEWDGTSWDYISPSDPEGDSNPPGSYAHSILYDPGREETVMLGGTNSYGPRDDLWAWNGTSWHLVDVADPEGDGSPAPRYGHTMAYDTLRSRLFLYGGHGVNRDVWHGRWGTLERPGHIAHFPMWAAGNCEAPEKQEIQVYFRSGATPGAGSNGVSLLLWDEGRWRSVATNLATAASPSTFGWVTTDEDEMHRLLHGDFSTVNVAVVPRGYNQGSDASLVTDHVQVAVKYRITSEDAPDQCD